MYDAIEDPYTYTNSTVLVNKLDLQNQAELDAFEAEISSARAEEPLPDEQLDFAQYYGYPSSSVSRRLSRGRPGSHGQNIERRQSILLS